MPGATDALRIAAEFNVGPIQAGMNESAAAVEAGSARMKASFEEVAAVSEHSVTEARHALHGLGEELGVHMPRFVQNFVARLGGVGPLMAAAFTPIAIVGLLEVLQHVPEALQNGIDALAGFDAEMKKVMGATREQNIKLQMEQIKTNYELAKIGAEGLGPAQKIAAEMRALGADTKQTGELMAQFQRQLNDAKKIAETPGLFSAIGKDIAGSVTSDALHDYFAHSNKEIEDAKKAVEDYQKAIDQLSEHLKAGPVTKAGLNVDAQREQIKLSNEVIDMNRRNEESVRQLADYYHQLDLEQKQLVADRQLFGEQASAKDVSGELKRIEEVGQAERRFQKDMEDLQNARMKRSPEIERQMIVQEMAAISQRLEFEKATDAKAYAEDLARYTELIRKKQQLDMQLRQSFSNAITGISADFNRGFVSWMNGQETFARAMQHVWTSIADTIVSSLLKAAEQMLANAILQRQIFDSTKIPAAKKAFRDTYAAVSGIPIIGPFLAPEAAAAAFAEVMAFAKGGIVPHDTPALLHANEMVLPAHISAQVQAAAASRSGPGGHTFNYTYNGSGSREDGARSHRDFMKTALRELRRRGFSAT